jgi:long-chain acyl-CoA synthetase
MPTTGLRSLSLGEILEEHRRSLPNQVAVVSEGQVLTFPQFADRVIRLANALEAAGVGAGDRILWLAQNTHGVLEGLIAAGRIGALFCPANWRMSAAEMAFVIDDLEPKVAVWQDAEIGDAVRAARRIAKHQGARWLDLDGTAEESYEAFVAHGSRQDRERPVDPDRPALIIYTAAFGGRPAGAMLSQTAILWQDLVLVDVQNLSSDTVFLNSGPLFHVGTLMVTLATFHVGGTNVFIRRSDPAAIAEAIHRHRCTYAFLVQSICHELATLNRERRYDFKCLRSASVSPEWDAMVSVTPSRNLFGFGQTETMGPIAWTYYGWGKTSGRNGRTGPAAQVRIFDDAGNELPPGEIGEIAVRGPTVMNGYWRRPELTAARQGAGWHRTNDLGKRETDGSLTFVGPKTQMIKSGAENIYPAEVEGCLKSHPAVADCGVIGVPDDTWVQSVKAIVQLRPGASVAPDQLIEHCRERIASYKKPRFVEFTHELPRTPAGVIDYKMLDADYGGGGYPGGFTRGA